MDQRLGSRMMDRILTNMSSIPALKRWVGPYSSALLVVASRRSIRDSVMVKPLALHDSANVRTFPELACH